MGYIAWGVWFRDSATMEPIIGAIVQLLDRSTHEIKYSGMTDSYGHCTIHNVEVPPEFYILRVSKSGYATLQHLEWVQAMGTLGGPEYHLSREAPYVPPPEPYLPPYIPPEPYVPPEEPPEEPPVEPPEEPPAKACVIATVFLGSQHPLLAPMRKFRDLFIPRPVMDLYYSVSVFVLRKIGRI